MFIVDILASLGTLEGLFVLSRRIHSQTSIIEPNLIKQLSTGT